MRVLRTASFAAAVGLLLGAMPAAASCVGPVPIEESLRAADSVFVGSVVGLANADRTATFAVDEVWGGPDLPAQVVIHGGPDGDGFTSADRTWEATGAYLVFASIVDGQLTDSACSNTQIWSDDLRAFQPSDARPPSDPTDGGAAPELPGALLVVVGVVAAVGLVSFLVFRRAQ